MYGAILGDIIGSIYEFDFNNINTAKVIIIKNSTLDMYFIICPT